MAKTPSSVWRNPLHFIAFGFGSGAAPVAPGTFGTLAAVLCYLLLGALPLVNYLLLIAVSFVLGIYICGRTSNDVGVADHSGIVWDEFVGYFVTMILAPPGWLWIALGFVLFRLFDIWKPWPISWLDAKVHGGLGIMLDDLVAGFYALLVLQLIALFVL